jgi:hypothetical protein
MLGCTVITWYLQQLTASANCNVMTVLHHAHCTGMVIKPDAAPSHVSVSLLAGGASQVCC